MRERASGGDSFGAEMTRGGTIGGSVRAHGEWGFECYGPDGEFKWYAPMSNLVVNEGLDELLNATLKLTGSATAWYIGLVQATTSSTAFQNSDAYGSTGMTWSESTDYSEASLQQWSGGTVSGQSVDNSSTKAAFSINANGTTIGGAFLVSKSAKGVTGTTSASTDGLMYAAGRFSVGNKQADDGDTLKVTGTFTAST